MRLGHAVLSACVVATIGAACARTPRPAPLPEVSVATNESTASASATASKQPRKPAQRDRNPAFYTIPQDIGPFTRIGTHVYDETAWGSQYRYRGPDSLEVDVYLYAGPDLGRTCDSTCGVARLQAEWRDFRSSIPQAVERGYYEELRVLSDSMLWPAAGDRWWMGYGATMKMRRGGTTMTSLFQLQYSPYFALKTRASYAPSDSRTRAIQQFNREVGAAFQRLPMADNTLPAPTAPELLRLANGRWSWTADRNSCSDSDHSIRVSADGSKFYWRDRSDTTGADETTYVIERIGPGIIEGRDHVIRASIVGETRTTASGALVVWDLVFLTANRYTWHRADWPPTGETADVIRCQGEWPMEPPQ